MFRGVIDFGRYWWIFRSESRDALSHRQYKGAQVTSISRLRKREGIQEAVPVLVLSSQRWYCQHTGATQKCRLFTSGALFFHPPTHLKKKGGRQQETNYTQCDRKATNMHMAP